MPAMANDTSNSTPISKALEQMVKRIQSINKAPILFCGSGLSRRYYNAPDWTGLLKKLSKELDFDATEFENNNSDENNEAWATELEYVAYSKNPPDRSKGESRRDPLRTRIARIVGCDSQNIIESMRSEIEAFSKISPATVITTNYDEFLEKTVFPKRLEKVIGDEIIPSEISNTAPSIFKIHGCVTKPSSIVITKEDYDVFMVKAKYLYAKLMTFFFEYPIVFAGYSISDRNIKAVLKAMVDVMNEEQLLDLQSRVWILGHSGDNSEECVNIKEISLDDGKALQLTEFCINESYELFFKSLSNATSSLIAESYRFTISDNAINLFIKPLYKAQNKLKVVIRELLQNAVDACRAGNNNISVGISVTFDGNKSTLKVWDQGIGMNSKDINDYFLVVGKSSKNTYYNLTGSFGIGILSVFLIGNNVKVVSKKQDGNTIGINIFQNDDAQEKEVTAISSPEFSNNNAIDHGTEIIISFCENSLDLQTKGIVDGIRANGFNKNKDNVIKDILGIKDLLCWDKNENISYSLNVQADNTLYQSGECFIDIIEDKQDFSTSNSGYLHIYNGFSSEKYNADRALINGSLTSIEFDKSFNKGLCKKLPFVVINTDSANTRKCIEPVLDRNKVTISGEVAENLKDLCYKREAEQFIKSIEKATANIKGFYKKALNGCSLISYDMVSFCGNRIYIGNTIHEVLSIYCGNYRFIDQVPFFSSGRPDSEYTYKQEKIDRRLLGDMIEDYNDRLIAIGMDLVNKFLLDAYDSHNGLRQSACRALLEHFNIDEINYDNASSMWASIQQNRELIKNSLDGSIQKGMLWLDNNAFHDIIESIPSSFYPNSVYSDTVIVSESRYCMDELMIQTIEEQLQLHPKMNQYIVIERQLHNI